MTNLRRMQLWPQHTFILKSWNGQLRPMKLQQITIGVAEVIHLLQITPVVAALVVEAVTINKRWVSGPILFGEDV